MIVGLTARQVDEVVARAQGRAARACCARRSWSSCRPRRWPKPKMLLGTYGSDALAPAALAEAKRRDAALVVCFIRQVNLSYKYDGEQRLTIDTDLAALRTFSRFLDLGHETGVPVIPVYDTGPDAAELMAENAAIVRLRARADRHQPAGRAVSPDQGSLPAAAGSDPAAGDSGAGDRADGDPPAGSVTARRRAERRRDDSGACTFHAIARADDQRDDERHVQPRHAAVEAVRVRGVAAHRVQRLHALAMLPCSQLFAASATNSRTIPEPADRPALPAAARSDRHVVDHRDALAAPRRRCSRRSGRRATWAGTVTGSAASVAAARRAGTFARPGSDETGRRIARARRSPRDEPFPPHIRSIVRAAKTSACRSNRRLT